MRWMVDRRLLYNFDAFLLLVTLSIVTVGTVTVYSACVVPALTQLAGTDCLGRKVWRCVALLPSGGMAVDAGIDSNSAEVVENALCHQCRVMPSLIPLTESSLTFACRFNSHHSTTTHPG